MAVRAPDVDSHDALPARRCHRGGNVHFYKESHRHALDIEVLEAQLTVHYEKHSKSPWISPISA